MVEVTIGVDKSVLAEGGIVCISTSEYAICVRTMIFHSRKSRTIGDNETAVSAV